MDGLRWLLLLVGVLVVAGVYWYSRRQASAQQQGGKAERREPSITAAADETVSDNDPYASLALAEDDAGVAADTDAADEQPPEKIVTLRLVAAHRGSFPGDELALGLRAAGMRHGRFGIFHCYDDDDEDRVVFSAASLVEPGSFDLANLREQRFPGISLFMVLPGPLDGASAFDQMMAAARELAAKLDAELLDESGSTLSIQRERYLREEIIQYQLGVKVA